MNLFSFYSILFLLGRGNYQLSIINYPLSIIELSSLSGEFLKIILDFI
ncbi:MAG: hypothetical protein AB4080_20100 [Trichodesmium sp.]